VGGVQQVENGSMEASFVLLDPWHITILQDDSSAGKTHSNPVTATVGDELVDVNHLVPITCLSVKSEIKVS
jgi:hypothetical protein